MDLEYIRCAKCNDVLPFPGPQCDCELRVYEDRRPKRHRTVLTWPTIRGGQASMELIIEGDHWVCVWEETASAPSTNATRGTSRGSSTAHRLGAVLADVLMCMFPADTAAVLDDAKECIHRDALEVALGILRTRGCILLSRCESTSAALEPEYHHRD